MRCVQEMFLVCCSHSTSHQCLYYVLQSSNLADIEGCVHSRHSEGVPLHMVEDREALCSRHSSSYRELVELQYSTYLSIGCYYYNTLHSRLAMHALT